MNIGFIGTGIMGKPMAYNLQQAGHTLYGNSWLSARDVTWYANVTTCKIPLIQHEKYNQSGLSGLVIPFGCSYGSRLLIIRETR